MKKLSVFLGVLVAISLLFTACAPAAAPTAVMSTVVVTQIVAGTPVEKIITATPAPTKDTSKEPITLRFTTWTSNETQLKTLNEIAAAYKVKNPNVTVKFDSIAYDEYSTKITVQLAGGDPPDMGWVVETAAASWIKAGILEELTPKLKATADYDFADFLTAPLGFWVRGEQVYAIPFSTSPFFVIYNADLFKAAGLPTPTEMVASKTWTWENFAKAAKAITEKGEKGTYGWFGIEGGNMYTANLWNTIAPFIWSYGGDVWSADYATCKLNTPESVKALQLMQQMVVTDKSVVPPGETGTITSGKVGMAFGQLSRIGGLKDAKFKWGIAPMPSGVAGLKPTIGQAAIAVFKSSKNKAAALDFLTFITNKENIAKMAAYWPPIRKSVLTAELMAKGYPTLDVASIQSAIVDSIINGAVVPSHPDFAKVDLTVHPMFDKIWVKDANVQALMDEACKAAAAYFKK